MGPEPHGGDRLTRRMREGITGAVRAGGRLRELRPPALAAFLAAAAFAPLLASGSGDLTILLNQLGSLGSGYLAAVLTSAADRDQPEDLAEVIEAGIEAPGEPGARMRAEVSAALRQVGAVEAVMAADPRAAAGLADLGGQLTEFGWMLGDATEQLALLTRQSARHNSHVLAARAELAAQTALLQRLVQAQDQGLGPLPGGSARCPYPGMRPFESKDAVGFFGREDLTAHLLARLAEQAGTAAPLVVVGPSGAGKSSLLRAGLIPALRRGRLLPIAGSATWPRILVDQPGADPLAALAAAMGGTVTDDDPATVAAGLGRPGRFVLVVDQFEEIFTQCPDRAVRARFVSVLLALASRGLVVLGIRADFYQDCASLAGLGPLLADNQLVVGPLAEEDLRRAITLPAMRAGCTVEPGLAELMIADLGLRPGTPSYEPGALPLLGYALRATWERRTDSRLSVAAYREAGGIHGAVAAEAERIYADLSADSREAARRMLLRMISVGPDGQLGRRRVTRADLLAGRDETGTGAAVLARFTRARLVTADTDGAEITHEAFLAAWPRLADWIAEDRAGLRLHRQLGEDARSWDTEKRDPGSLYRGTRLGGAAAWRAGHEAELTDLERAFLEASTVAEEAGRHRERRQNRRLRVLAAGLAVVLAAALAAGGVAVHQRRAAVNVRDLEQSAGLAAQSDVALPLNLRTSDLDALAAWQAGRTEAARSSLLSRQDDPYLGSFHEPSQNQVTVVAISPNRKLLAVAEQPGPGGPAAAQTSIQIWDLATGQETAVFPRQGGSVHTLAFSPDSRTLAAVVYSGNGLRFWDMASYRRLPDPFSESGLIGSVSYAPSGGTLAIGVTPLNRLPVDVEATKAPSVIDVWDTVRHRRVRQLTGLTGFVNTLSFGAEGHLLASGDSDGQVELWDPAAGARPAALDREPAGVNQVLFSPDGGHVAISLQDAQVLVIGTAGDQFTSTRLLAFTGPSSAKAVYTPIAFGPEGKFLYAATDFGNAMGIYDVAAQGRVIPDYQMPGPVLGLATSGPALVGGGAGGVLFALDLGQRTLMDPALAGLTTVATSRSGLVATGASNGAVQVWSPSDPARTRQLPSPPVLVNRLDFSRDGRLLAAAYSNCDVRIWRLDSSQPSQLLTPPRGSVPPPGAITFAQADFIPGSSMLVTDCSFYAAGHYVNTVLLRDRATGAIRMRPSLPIAQRPVTDLAVSPRGHMIAVDTGTGTVLLLRVSGPQVTISRQISPRQGLYLWALAFSPDGQLLASTGVGSTVKLWHTATGTPAGIIGAGISDIRGLVFSPDGATLATVASEGTTISLYNVRTRHLTTSLATFPAAISTQIASINVNQAAFLPGNQLVTVLSNGTATVWDLSPAREIRRLCHVLDPATITTWWHNQNPPPGLDPCITRATPAMASRR